MNLRKSLLSLAAVAALSTSVTADGTATYLPLSSGTTDSVWTLFGVNGFSNGVPDSLTGSSSGSFQAGFTELEDTIPTDEAAVSGLAAAAGGGNMATLQSLDGTPLKVGMDMAGTIFNVTESVRTMYVKIDGSVQNMQFEYKASLEGKGIEILYDSVLYSVPAISQAYTWDNAVVADLGGLNSGPAGGDRSKIVEVLDATFNDNPANPAHFDKDIHLDTTTLHRGNFYYFNAINQQWEVWNANAVTNANDFDEFHVGKAYWGRTDKVDLIQNADGASGLILGSAPAGTPTPSIYEDAGVSRLTEGWNMVSFSDAKPTIRHAATGLILTGVAVTDTLVITDDSGLHSFTYDISAGTNAIDHTTATAINEGIEAAKLLGTLPKTFNVKVFYAGAAGSYIIISDKKFSIAETDGTSTVVVRTLTGSDPYVAGVITAVPDLGVPVVATSVYGEYTMMIDLMVGDLANDDGALGTNVAAALDNVQGDAGANGSAQIIFGEAGTDDAAINLSTNLATDVNPTFANAQTQINAGGRIATAGINAIDIDNDGNLDKVILADDAKFYVKDNTHIKILEVDPSTTTGTSITVEGASTVVIPTLANVTRNTLVTDIGAVADAGATPTNVYAAQGTTATNLILVSTTANSFDVKDRAHATDDLLSRATSDDNLVAKGAVGSVYALDEIAALPLAQHIFTTSFATEAQPTNALATLDIQLNALPLIDELAVGAAAIVPDAAGRKAYFDLIVNNINSTLTTAGIHAYATHDFDEATDDFAGTTILVSGVDITVFTIVAGTVADGVADIIPSVPVDSNAAVAGTLGTSLPTIAVDVKENPVYTPDFAEYGPLYTMRKAGYDVRGILKATTDMDTAGAGAASIVWDSLDVTADEDDWFRDNEYNLFNINHNSGYWAYLTPKDADSVVIGTPEFDSLSYSYYFAGSEKSYATTNMITSASLSVVITGLDDADSSDVNNNAGSAYAIIAGERVQLKRTSSNSDTYTANVSDMALASFDEDASPINVDIRAVNGKGEAVLSSGAYAIDYAKPTNVSATRDSATNIALSADAGTTENFYIYENFIPEIQSDRAAALVDTVPLVAGSAVSYNACANSAFSFGETKNLRIVAADGTMNASNVSDAVNFSYAVTLKGSHVLTHQDGDATRAQIGRLYTDSCVLEATQPSVPADNNGVSIKTLTNSFTSTIAFVPVAGVNFTRDVAWTTNYDIAGSGTAVVQIQSTSDYAGQTFFVEYNSNLYTGTFVSTEAAADATTTGGTPLALTIVTASNNTLAP